LIALTFIERYLIVFEILIGFNKGPESRLANRGERSCRQRAAFSLSNLKAMWMESETRFLYTT
jgi:hypothetical protein